MARNGKVEEQQLDAEHELPPSEEGEGSSPAQPTTSSDRLSEVEKLRAERDTLLDRLARAQAEFDNARKRAAKEQQDFRDYALLIGIDREHLAFLFAGNIYFAVTRIDADAFRFFRHFYFPARLAGVEINNRSTGIVFIRDKGEFSILANRELLRI